MIIYKTTNTVNGKIYVGKDEKNDPKYLGSGIYLQRAIEKYGKDHFRKEILESCDSKELLCQREIFWIAELDARNPKVGYNIALGGEGGWPCNLQRTFEERSSLSKKAMETMGAEGLRQRAITISENLGEEGRSRRSYAVKQTYDLSAASKKALLKQSSLNTRAIASLGKEGLVSRSLKAAETLGREGRKLKAQKANHTRYHKVKSTNCPFCNERD